MRSRTCPGAVTVVVDDVLDVPVVVVVPAHGSGSHVPGPMLTP
jgi:hypothetical protein